MTPCLEADEDQSLNHPQSATPPLRQVTPEQARSGTSTGMRRSFNDADLDDDEEDDEDDDAAAGRHSKRSR
jgi:hypothetical protein